MAWVDEPTKLILERLPGVVRIPLPHHAGLHVGFPAPTGVALEGVIEHVLRLDVETGRGVVRVRVRRQRGV